MYNTLKYDDNSDDDDDDNDRGSYNIEYNRADGNRVSILICAMSRTINQHLPCNYS